MEGIVSEMDVDDLDVATNEKDVKILENEINLSSTEHKREYDAQAVDESNQMTTDIVRINETRMGLDTSITYKSNHDLENCSVDAARNTPSNCKDNVNPDFTEQPCSKTAKSSIRGSGLSLDNFLINSDNNLLVNKNENNDSCPSIISELSQNAFDTQNLPSCSKDSHLVERTYVTNRNIQSPISDEDASQAAPSTDTNNTSSVNNEFQTDHEVIGPSTSNRNDYYSSGLHREVKLYAEDNGPKIYSVKGNIVTPPIITRNLPEAFKFMPIHGMPKSTANVEEFQNTKIREYIACDLGDEEFNNLALYCSPDYLKTGNELKMMSRYPTQEPLPDHTFNALELNGVADNLCIVKKLKLRVEKDTRHLYTKRLKYRGLRILPLPQNEEYKISFSPLEPGKDLVFRVRVYRPFYCSGRERQNTRHSVFSNDIVLLGRQRLTALRDRLVCANDVGMRYDVSDNPEDQPTTAAKDVFPSGFLFINNKFYVDTRGGCQDHSLPIREWAVKRKIGVFPKYDMTQVTIDQLLVKLGHPEVYVHQGNCEHLFTFSEVRLLGAADPLRHSSYPHHTALSHHQTVYCTTCAEFGAKWIVTGCARVPFDPAFFCDSCFKLYLYKDGRKICDFKAYSYRGNELNLLKPTA